MTLRRNPSASRRSTGTSKVVRRLAKYSSICRATASSRAGDAQDAGAHGVGEPGQHGVVALDVVGDADQADGGGGQQQRADRGVDGAVGDVEQPVGRRRRVPAARAAGPSSASSACSSSKMLVVMMFRPSGRSCAET